MLFCEMSEALLGLLCLLTFVTLVGHGVWVVVAWAWRAAVEINATHGTCPRCQGLRRVARDHCDRCGWPRPARPILYRSPLYHQLEEALERAWEQGVIPLEAYRAIRKELVEEPSPHVVPPSERLSVAPAAERKTAVPPQPQPTPTFAASTEPPPAALPALDAAPAAPEAPIASMPVDGPLPPFPSVETGPPATAATSVLAEGSVVVARTQADRVEPAPSAFSSSAAPAPLASPARLSDHAVPDPLGDPDPVAPAPASPAASASPTSPASVDASKKPARWGAFLEERNIRWGELVGGLLVVGSSISLVVSFREQIHDRPWLQFALLNAFTASFFLLGLHVERSWKLVVSGRALLSIAVLLTPLNFWAVGKIGGSEDPWSLLRFVGEAGTIVLFAPLLYWAASVLAPRMRVEFACGVLSAAACPWLFRRAAALDSAQPVLEALALLPPLAGAVFYFAPARRERLRRFASAEADAGARLPGEADDAAWNLLFLLGFLSFAVAIALGFMLPQLVDPLGFARRWSPLWAVAGMPLLWSSMLLLQKTGERLDPKLATAGVALAAAAALFPVASLALAWPAPGRIALAAAATAFAAAATAWAFRTPLLHAAVAGAVGLSYVVLAPALRGVYEPSIFDDARRDGAALAEGLLRTELGLFLLPLAAVFGGAAALFGLRKRAVESRCYAIAASAAATAGWICAMAQGFARYDDHGAVWVLALFAAAACAAALYARRASMSFLAGALSFPACLQLVCFHLAPAWNLQEPWSDALLLHAWILLALSAPAGWKGDSRRLTLLLPLGAFVVLDLAFVWPRLVIQSFTLSPGRLVPLAAVTAGAAAFLVWTTRSPRLIPAARGLIGTTWLLFLAACFEYAPDAPSWAERIWPGSTPQTLPIVGCGMALFSLGSTLLWAWTERRLPTESIWRPSHWGTSPRFEAAIDLVATRGLGAAVLAVFASRTLWELTGADVAYTGTGFLRHPDNPLLPVFAGPGAVLALLLFVSFAARALFVPGSFKILTPARVAPALGLLWLLALLVLGWNQGLSGATYRNWSGLFVLLVSAAIAFPDQLPSLLRRLLHSLEPSSEEAANTARGIHPKESAAESARTKHERRAGLWADGSLGVIAVVGAVVPAALRSFTAVGGVPVHGAFAGEAFSFLFPLAAVAAGAATLGVRRNEPWRLLFGAAVVGPAAALAYWLLDPVAAGQRIPPRVAAGLQWCTFAWAVYSLAWLGFLYWQAQRSGAPLVRQRRHAFLVKATCGGMLLALAPPLAALTIRTAPPMLTTGPMWWITLLATTLAVLAPQWARREPLAAGRWIPLCWAVLGLAALSLPSPHWSPERVRAAWLLGTGALGAAIPWVAVRTWPQQRGTAILWTVGLSLFSLAGAMDAVWKPAWAGGSPPADYHLWVSFPWFCAAIGAVGLAEREKNSYSLWIAAICLAAAATGFFQRLGFPLEREPFLGLQFAVWLLPTPLWLLLGNRCRAAAQTAEPWALHRALAAAGLTVLALLLASHLAKRGLHPFAPQAPWVVWTMVGGVAVALGCGLWDRSARGATAQWYLWGGCLLVAGVMSADAADAKHARAALTVFLACYTVATAYLWSRRASIAAAGARVGMIRSVLSGEGEAAWFVLATLAAAALVQIDALFQTMHQTTWPMRFLMGKAALLQAVAILFLASPPRPKEAPEESASPEDEEARLNAAAQQLLLCWTTFLATTVGAVVLGWACVDPEDPAAATHRAAASLVVLAGAFALAGIVAPRRFSAASPWREAAVDQLPILGLFTAVALSCLLGTEATAYANGEPLELLPWARIAAPGGLLALAATATAIALAPRRRSPFDFAVQRLQAVYAAIGLCVATFFHLRVTSPAIFDPLWRPYWPLVVVFASFLALGAAENLRRPRGLLGRRRLVLALPLESFAAAAPAAATATAWFLKSSVNISLVFLACAGVYAAFAALRRSRVWGAASFAAMLASYWSLLNQTAGWGFLEHPQAWLTPLNLAILAAAELQRKQLKPRDYQSLVYLGAAGIYVSSTADVFLQGVAQAPWLPLVLGAWAVLGVLAGMQLRVRAFLFLGVAFLILALGIMIRHAAVDLQMTWIWSAAGVLTGIVLLVLFGLFEHRRETLLKQFGKLREWDA